MNTINLVLLQYCLSSGKIMVRSDNLRVQEVGPARVSGPKGPEEPVQQQHQDGQDEGQLPVPRDGDAGGKVVRLLPELGPQALHSPL